jgi:hypothetical protein
MGAERRRGERITFERGIPVHIIAIDGTWQRDCKLEDVSETGAKLSISESSEEVDLKEFFLLLSSTGLAYRRCELAWQNGGHLGVNFVRPEERRKKSARRVPAAAEV